MTSGFTPTWSPDGTRLSFSDLHQDNNDIFLIDSDGSGRRPLTGHPSDELYPSWAPDGQHVAFERDGQIWIVRLTDGHQTILSTGDTIDSTPAWSFDGQWIAFSSRFEDTNGNGQIDYNDNSQVMVANTDGTNRTALTAFPENTEQPIWAQNPDWSPDGTRLAFESNRDGQWDIWVINRNDSTLKNLTAEAKGSVNLNPHWLPTVN